jgi:KDO2-lipid IV(A) lauroyltransferase
MRLKKILVLPRLVDKVCRYFKDCMSRLKIIRRNIRRPFETGAFLLAKWLVPVLPRFVLVGLSKAAGHLAMGFPLREKTIGLKNLDAVFGKTLSAGKKREILATSFATFVLTMLDIFWFSRNPHKRIPRYVEFEDSPAKNSFFEDKAVICITAHMGNWEVLGQTSALMGAEMASIAATIKNKVVDRVVIEQRERTGQTIIPRRGALKSLIARLRNNGKAAFVLDQNTDEKDGGIEIDFLGLPMLVSPAPAVLAYRTGTVIMLGFCLPERGGRYRIRITQTIQPPPYDKACDIDAVAKELTQQIQDGISAEIRTHPESWLWAYKHWRRIDGHTYPPHYPDY